MKTKITVLLMVCMPLISQGQVFIDDVICSAGDLPETENISIQWNLGELAIITLSNEGHDITQGFGQYDYIVTSILPPGQERLKVEVYPNPVIETLHIALTRADRTTYIQLFDLNGNVLFRNIMEEDHSFLEMQDYLPGMYLLRVYQPPFRFAEFKIIKNAR